MKFLTKFDFTKEQLNYLDKNASQVMIEAIKKGKKLVSTNLKSLMDLGVKN